MALDTAVPGNPDSVLAAADWLGYTLAARVEGCAGALNGARMTAEADWDGPAGDLAAIQLRTGNSKGVDLQVGIVALAREFESFGHALRRAHERMAQIRTEALAAGLVVNGTVIEDPAGDSCAQPATPPAPQYGPHLMIGGPAVPNIAISPAVKAKAAPYAKAVGDAEFARDQLAEAADRMSDTYRGLQGPEWALEATDIAGDIAGGLMVDHAKILRKQAVFYAEEAQIAAHRLLSTDPAIVGRESYYRDHDRIQQLRNQSDELFNRAEELKTRGVQWPLKLGAALTVVGIAYEIHKGKNPVQAVTAGTGGFVASVGMGAAIGTMVPVPILGTVAGAVVGAGFGIFVSGSIDSLFEEGPDVGAAVEAGWDAVADTGKVIAGPVVGVGKAIGGLF